MDNMSYEVLDLDRWDINNDYVRVCSASEVVCGCKLGHSGDSEDDSEEFDLEEQIEQIICVINQFFSDTSTFTKEDITKRFGEEGTDFIDKTMTKPGANVEALQRTKRLFQTIYQNTNNILNHLVKDGCIREREIK